jgi:uncharacterized protein YjdB
MKKKSFIILFVMFLTLISFGALQKASVASAATVGQQLLQPEDGWQRIDDTDSKFLYTNMKYMEDFSEDYYYNQVTHYDNQKQSGKVNFKFYGTKLRIISSRYTLKSTYSGHKIKVDGQLYDIIQLPDIKPQIIVYEIVNLPLKIHDVEVVSADNNVFCFDAIDIDKDGYLIQSSITLDKTSIDLPKDALQKLTATTTPVALGITWTSSNTGVATVDENGNVKAIAEGQATITAQITGTDIKATCVVNVTKANTGKAILSISLTNGNTKEYDVTMDKVNDFIKWYTDRDKDKSDFSATYTFDKTINPYKLVKEYIVHDQIVSFEVREY